MTDTAESLTGLAYVIVKKTGHGQRAVWTCVWTIIRLATYCNVSARHHPMSGT